MKKNFKLTIWILYALLFIVLAFTPPKRSLTGQWVSYYGNGKKINYDFRTNGTFKVIIPDETFTVEGKFTLKNNVLSFNDGTCGLDYWGTYKTTFMGNDSIYSVVIEDSCMYRKSAVDKATIVRVKQ
ncbi:MAG TPA: hypothetical protein VMH01_04910 [Puia sp.]|nr:hypothetical protein [Puia sp.]